MIEQLKIKIYNLIQNLQFKKAVNLFIEQIKQDLQYIEKIYVANEISYGKLNMYILFKPEFYIYDIRKKLYSVEALINNKILHKYGLYLNIDHDELNQQLQPYNYKEIKID
jgi:hypothetical protein